MRLSAAVNEGSGGVPVLEGSWRKSVCNCLVSGQACQMYMTLQEAMHPLLQFAAAGYSRLHIAVQLGMID